MLADRIGAGVDLRPLAPRAGRRVVGVRFVDHDAVARVDPDVAGEEDEVAGRHHDKKHKRRPQGRPRPLGN